MPFLGVLFLLRGVARANHSPGFRGVSSRVSFTLLIVVIPVQGADDQEVAVRAFPVRLPSGARYWTVLDENLAVVPAADAFLRHVRFGRDGAESTTRSYAYSIALFLRWCDRSGRQWSEGAAHLGLFMTWLRHAGPLVSGDDPGAGAAVLAGPGAAPARSARRVNGVLTAVRGMVVHAAASGLAPGDLVPLLYEVADDRDLPGQARDTDGRMSWRLRARHRLREPETRVDRASDEEIVALLAACACPRGTG
jgi:integrase/recombinase XerD